MNKWFFYILNHITLVISFIKSFLCLYIYIYMFIYWIYASNTYSLPNFLKNLTFTLPYDFASTYTLSILGNIAFDSLWNGCMSTDFKKLNCGYKCWSNLFYGAVVDWSNLNCGDLPYLQFYFLKKWKNKFCQNIYYFLLVF